MEIPALADNPYILWHDYALWMKGHPKVEGWLVMVLFLGLALFLSLRNSSIAKRNCPSPHLAAPSHDNLYRHDH